MHEFWKLSYSNYLKIKWDNFSWTRTGFHVVTHANNQHIQIPINWLQQHIQTLNFDFIFKLPSHYNVTKNFDLFMSNIFNWNLSQSRQKSHQILEARLLFSIKINSCISGYTQFKKEQKVWEPNYISLLL